MRSLRTGAFVCLAGLLCLSYPEAHGQEVSTDIEDEVMREIREQYGSPIEDELDLDSSYDAAVIGDAEEEAEEEWVDDGEGEAEKVEEVEELLPEEPAAAANGEAPAIAPAGDRGCRWAWGKRKCEPATHCQYQYQFLDATPGESCRLKDRPAVAKHAAAGGLQLPPAAVVGGATALVAADVAVIAFTPALRKYPLAANIVQGFVLFLAGDAYFQVIEQGLKVKRVGLNAWRAFRSGLIGSLNNGLVHYSYYKFIDRRFPYEKFSENRWGSKDGAKYKLAVAFAKYCIEWPTVGAYKIASMYVLTGLLGGGSLAGVVEKFKDKFVLTMLRSLQVWPLYDTIMYAYIPTDHRPLLNAFMSIAWGGYLSHISQPEDGGEPEGSGSAAAHDGLKDEL